MRNSTECLDNQNNDEPIGDDMRGIINAPPINRPSYAPKTRIVFSAAAATSPATLSSSGSSLLAPSPMLACLGPVRVFHSRTLLEDVTDAAFGFTTDSAGWDGDSMGGVIHAVGVVLSLPKQILLAGSKSNSPSGHRTGHHESRRRARVQRQARLSV